MLLGDMMKSKMFFTLGILIFMAQKGICAVETVSPELEQSLKSQSHEPNFLTVLFALLVVVALIYVTGLIYSKLNLVGAKTVQTQLKNYDLCRAVVLSTTQLGPSSNLHVIELNKKRYLIGATSNSINLIKELGELSQEDVQSTKTEDERSEKQEKIIVDPMHILYGKPQDTSLEDLKKVEEFDVHKKYL